VRRGHPILGAISGFVFGLALSLALLVFAVVSLSNIILVILPIAFLVLGIAWALWAPLGASRAGGPAGEPAPQ
jgi:hypothetical protein